MSAHFDRATLLLEQGKANLDEQELRLVLAQEPENGPAHALLAMCLADRERFTEAEDEAKQSIHHAPDDSFSHYTLAKVLEDRRRFDEAEAAVSEAIRLDPEDADHHALQAQIRYNQRRWPAALEAAERGLECDPEHVGSTNLRAMALIKLDRKDEAGRTLDAALARDPEDALSHASQGWALLEQSEPKKALEHFREALRLDPEMEFARAGIVEALKARNPIYALMLRWFFWMARLGGKAQWAVIIGGYVGYRVVLGLATSNPTLAPWLMPLIIGYIAFALMTWLAAPLFNLTLRLSRFGRLALSSEQISASNAVGFCLFGAITCLIGWAVSGSFSFATAALFLGFLSLPVAGTFNCEDGWPKRIMTAYTFGLIMIMMAVHFVPFLILTGASFVGVVKLVETLSLVFLIGAFMSQWVVIGLAHVTPKR